jgi:cyclomaltodextrinase / maltogenic alpha-amylase / neopullulanase
MDFTLRQLILRTARGELEPRTGARMMARLIDDAGLENMLKSWLLLDNHDTVRLATELPDPAQRRLAQVWQFTLPGSPNLYYGSELGMTGGGDPEMRAPMRWDLARDDNPALAWTRQLVALRKARRALRVGDIRWLETSALVGFERSTDRLGDAVLVLANPSKQAVTEWVLLPDSKFMNMSRLLDLLDPASPPLPVDSAMVKVTLPPSGVVVLAPDTAPKAGYSPYKRVQ